MVYEVKAHAESDVPTNHGKEYTSLVPGVGGRGAGDSGKTYDVTVANGKESSKVMGRTDATSAGTGSITDDSIVSLGNTEMTAAQAYQHGLIQKDSTGNYVNPNNNAAQVSSEDTENDTTTTDDSDGAADGVDETLLADHETEARLETMTQNAGSSEAMEANVLKALHDADSDRAMSEVGEQLGVGSDAEVAREAAAQTYDGLYTAAVTHVESQVSSDVNVAEAFEWAGANMNKGDIIDAQIKWYNCDPSGLMNMVEKYQAR